MLPIAPKPMTLAMALGAPPHPSAQHAFTMTSGGLMPAFFAPHPSLFTQGAIPGHQFNMHIPARPSYPLGPSHTAARIVAELRALSAEERAEVLTEIGKAFPFPQAHSAFPYVAPMALGEYLVSCTRHDSAADDGRQACAPQPASSLLDGIITQARTHFKMSIEIVR